MQKRYIDGTNWKMCETTNSKIKYISDFISGYISFVEIVKAKEKFVVEYNGRITTLIDDGYKSIVFLPDNEYWCAQAKYDNENNIVEWYFDITDNNYVDENNKPCFEDLYLDVVLMPDGEIILFDEDELMNAYGCGEISQEQVKKAKATAERIIKEYIPNEKFIIDFFNKYLQFFYS